MGFSESKIAAKLQEAVSIRREEGGLYSQIASHLPIGESGRLLDIGTGTGLQLRVIGEQHPEWDLYGLDLSAKAIQIAQQYFEGGDVDLRVGSIQQTDYPDDHFDIVTCHSSMSYWKEMVACYNEIHRILKPGGAAVLFEPRKNIDIDLAMKIIRKNLEGESKLRIFLAVNLNKFGLRYGRSLGMRLYAMEEIEALARQSAFGEQVSVEPVELLNLAIFMKITLTKAGG